MARLSSTSFPRPRATCPLRDLASIRAGFPTRRAVEPDPEGTHRLLQVRDVVEDQHVPMWTGAVRFTAPPSAREHVLLPGDILFLAKAVRPFALALGDLPESALASSSFHVIRIRDTRLRPDFLAWYLNQPPAQAHVGRLAGKGAALPVVRRSVLEALPVPLPSLSHQATIAELDHTVRCHTTLLAELAEQTRHLASGASLRSIRPPTPPGAPA